MINDIQKHLDKLEETLKEIGGCCNSGCLIHRRGGQVTNGPCHCLRYPKDKYTTERVVKAYMRFKSEIESILETHALVPREPTEEMLNAKIWNESSKQWVFESRHDLRDVIYKAMIGASDENSNI
jgi:hypothetical protein